MGLNFKEIVVKEEISISNLSGKILAVDSMNLLYQFLTTIRAPDGAVFTDKQGRVTSHLIGLFHRTATLLEQGIKLVFVFDGKPPDIKQKTWEKRTAIKQEATLKLKEAEELGNLNDMKKFASRTAVLTKDMRDDAKRIITALGCPIVQAPSEGEAQTAYMVKTGKAYASVSQDYDNLIFGCPRLIRNLSLEGKRKKKGTLGWQIIKPEMIELKDVLQHLKLTQGQLTVLAILVGTDYNPGGVPQIGPKKGLKLLYEYKANFNSLFESVQWSTYYPDLPWQQIFDTIKHIPVTDDYTLTWKSINDKELFHLLVHEHNFSEERVISKIATLKEAKLSFSQKGLGQFF